jgi:hypothetical protein
MGGKVLPEPCYAQLPLSWLTEKPMASWQHDVRTNLVLWLWRFRLPAIDD